MTTNREHIVVLRVTQLPLEGHPEDWDWDSMVSSAEFIESIEVTDVDVKGATVNVTGDPK